MRLIPCLLSVLLITAQVFCEAEAATKTALEGLKDAAFSIPLFPGTEVLEPSASSLTVSPPYATLTVVLRAEKGGRIDEAKAIDFYKDALIKKGWKEDASLTPPAGSRLTLRCRFFDPARGQNLSGEFNLYVAPSDGIVTIFLKQWRNSSAGAQADRLFPLLKKELDDISKEAYVVCYSSGRLCRWERFFEDEDFIEGIYYNWTTEGDHPDMVEAIVALYSDEQAAEKAKRNFSSEYELIEAQGNALIIVHSYPERAPRADAQKKLIFKRITSCVKERP